MGSVGERARARSEAEAKAQAFSALLVARIAFLSAGLAMAGLTVWAAASIWLLAGGPTGELPILLIPVAFAAIGLLAARYVVHRPWTWAIVLGIVWLPQVASFLMGTRVSAAHAAGVVGVLTGCVSIFRVRATLEAHPRLWEEMLAADAPLAAPRRDSVRRFQRIALVAGLVAVAGAGVYAWASLPPDPPGYESSVLRKETAANFLETWNGGNARAIASLFRPEVRDQIANGLPGFVREAGFPEWPRIRPGYPDRDETFLTIDFRVDTPRVSYLHTDWEWRDDRWTLMSIDFGSELR